MKLRDSNYWKETALHLATGWIQYKFVIWLLFDTSYGHGMPDGFKTGSAIFLGAVTALYGLINRPKTMRDLYKKRPVSKTESAGD